MVFRKISTFSYILCTGISLSLLLFVVINPSYAKTHSHFPNYRTIQDNVVFWQKVYSKYSTNAAIFHDKDNLTRIYAVLHLLAPELPGAPAINKITKKSGLKNYRYILKKLARGAPPVSADERRIAALFKGPHARKHMRKAADNIRIQMGLKERFIEGHITSGKYISQIKRIFQSYGLPTNLAYLPHVESSFNVAAYSKYGAAGIWQFTRSTGKEFMTINNAIDERKDPIIATHAAAKFLKRNYDTLGTWPLAITAYNYGPAGMQRALKAKGSYERIFTSYREGHFKFAAQNFYAEFLAAVNTVNKLEQSSKIHKAPPLSTTSLKLPGYIHISDIRKHFKTNIETIKDLNPALLPPVYKGEKLIPKGYHYRIEANVKNLKLARKLPITILKKNQTKDTYYIVKRGDTAGKIAAHHKVSLKKLKKANNLDRAATVKVGHKLRIPAQPIRRTSLKPTVLIAATPMKNFPNKNRAENLSKPIPIFKKNQKTFPKLQPSLSSTHKKRSLNITSLSKRNGNLLGKITTQPTESLGVYAQWLLVSENQLKAINHINLDNNLHPGQKLTLIFNQVTPKEFANKRLEYHRTNEETFFSSFQIIGLKKYTVSPGDTLWDICNNKFTLPYWLLKKFNRKLDFATLAVNQDLTIPIVQAL